MTSVNSEWQLRRVVITSQSVSFALVGKDDEIDVIPLSEVSSVDEMGQDEPTASSRVSAQSLGKGIRMWPASKTPASSEEDAEAAVQSKLFNNSLHIKTLPDGYNSGRSYYLQAGSAEEIQKLLLHLQKLSETARAKNLSSSRFRQSQGWVRALYISKPFQTTMAFLIVANFIVNLVEAQLILTSSSDLSTATISFTLDTLNLFFTAVFAAELTLNAYAHWFLPFVQNAWSMLDAFVVIMSLVALGPVDLPISILRLMRALRVIRLFGRLKALKKMVSALTASIVPMMNAFLILFIISSIYAVMGVSLFADDSFADFGRFSHAFVTMFHLTSEGAWPPNVVALEEDGGPSWTISVFCISYVILVNWVVLQVSVAVLLDSFVSASSDIDEAERRQRQDESRTKHQTKSPLEPLLRKFALEFVDDTDLSARLRRLFEVLDIDGSGSLSSEEFCAAIKRLSFKPRIHMAPSDFLSFTRGGEICNASGDIGPDEFELAMREQIRMYSQALLCHNEQRSRAELEQTHMIAIKWMLTDSQRIRRDLQHLCSTSPERGASMFAKAGNQNRLQAAGSILPSGSAGATQAAEDAQVKREAALLARMGVLALGSRGGGAATTAGGGMGGCAGGLSSLLSPSSEAFAFQTTLAESVASAVCQVLREEFREPLLAMCCTAQAAARELQKARARRRLTSIGLGKRQPRGDFPKCGKGGGMLGGPKGCGGDSESLSSMDSGSLGQTAGVVSDVGQRFAGSVGSAQAHGNGAGPLGASDHQLCRIDVESVGGNGKSKEPAPPACIVDPALQKAASTTAADDKPTARWLAGTGESLATLVGACRQDWPAEPAPALLPPYGPALTPPSGRCDTANNFDFVAKPSASRTAPFVEAVVTVEPRRYVPSRPKPQQVFLVLNNSAMGIGLDDTVREGGAEAGSAEGRSVTASALAEGGAAPRAWSLAPPALLPRAVDEGSDMEMESEGER